jgi:ATP phosphoribosyltransferase regulatory subunit
MSSQSENALLPAGLGDLLPPEAGFEAEIVEKIISVFSSFGYDRVKPPLIEFEESLLSGVGEATKSQTFRLMDPVSQKMLGLRPDMTLQMARIASTRLKNQARPLRMSYAGQVLRVKGSQLRPERQFGQIGAELIGSASPLSDAEVILMAVEALTAIGVTNLTVDIGIPTLVPALCQDFGLSSDVTNQLENALDRKDAAEVAAIGGEAAKTFGALLSSAGPVDTALATLESLSISGKAAQERQALIDVVRLVKERNKDISLTVDTVERRGYEYHSGVTFTFFALNVRGELGRGGRYLGGEAQEPSSGASLFTDSLLRALPAPMKADRVFMPHGEDAEQAKKLRKQGHSVVSALGDSDNPTAEAKRLSCTHIYTDGQIRRL